MLDIHGGRELRDVAACLGWQRNALPDVRGIAGRAGVVGGERAGHAEAVYHLAQIGSAGEDVVARGVGIDAQTVPLPKLGPGLRHELPQAPCARWGGDGPATAHGPAAAPVTPTPPATVLRK